MIDFGMNLLKKLLKLLFVMIIIPVNEIGFFLKNVYIFLTKDTKKAIAMSLRFSIIVAVIFFYYKNPWKDMDELNVYKDFIDTIINTIILGTSISGFINFTQPSMDKLS